MMHKINYNYNSDETITAIATPLGKGAISIIRITGVKSLMIISGLFQTGNYQKCRINKAGTYIGYIVAEDKIIDQVVLLVKKAPYSFTGEDLVEVHCHGSILITNMLLGLITSRGARLAEPGEFTLRAFLNNKIDLIQAESINDLINTKNISSMEMAVHNLSGRLSQEINAINKDLKELLINIEVRIDHPDEEMDILDTGDILKTVLLIRKKIDHLVHSYKTSQILHKGINIGIIGKANVGKSSLFNLLIKRDKSIISHIPGTTRDVVEEYIEIDHFPIKLIDTAGIKKTLNFIEDEALKRTYQAVKETSILFMVFDYSKALSRDDKILLDYIKDYKGHKLILLNKADLPKKLATDQLKRLLKGNKFINISAIRELNIKKIEDEVRKILDQFHLKEDHIISNVRQRDILVKTSNHLNNVIESIDQNLPFDIMAVDVKNAVNELGYLTGAYTDEDMLGDIFSHFCLGK